MILGASLAARSILLYSMASQGGVPTHGAAGDTPVVSPVHFSNGFLHHNLDMSDFTGIGMPGDLASGVEQAAGSATGRTECTLSACDRLPLTASTDAQDISMGSFAVQESAADDNDDKTLRDIQEPVDSYPPLPNLTSKVERLDAVLVDVGRGDRELRKGILHTGSHAFVALKCLCTQEKTGVSKELLFRHLNAWSVRHRNVLELYGFCDGLTTDMKLVYPWMENGNILAYLSKNPGADRIRLMLDVACGVAHLHAQAPVIVHGALKPVRRRL